MSYPPNARILLEMLRQGGSPLANTPLSSGPGSPLGIMPNAGSYTSDAYDQQEANKRPSTSTGMLAPQGAAPGGAGTAIGTGASTPKNPAIISDPDSLQAMHTEIMRRMTEPVEVGPPPEAPQFPAAPAMAPLRGGFTGHLVAGLAGLGGVPNPFEIQRQQQFKDALEQWQSQVSPLQATYQDKLRAYAEQMKAKTEAALAKQHGAMAAGYMAPYFGISRTGTQPNRTATANQVGKVDLQQGIPVSIMTSEGRLPITDKYLPQMDQTIRDIALNSLDAHSRWFGEQLKLLQARGAAFRLNMMYPVWDKQANQLVNKTGYEILKEEYRYIPAPSALTMARSFGVAPTQDVIRRGQNAVQTLQQLPALLEKYDKVEQMGMTGPAHGRMFADFMAGKIGTTGMGPEADEAMGQLRASNEFFRTRLTQAHLGGQSSEAERAAIRDILGRLSGTPEMYKGGLDSAQSVLHDYASAVPGFGAGMEGVYNPFQSSPISVRGRTGEAPKQPVQKPPPLADIIKKAMEP